MEFNQYKSAYVAPPIEAYERTWEVLQNAYTQNRQNANQLTQLLNNVSVEDRNIGHLNNAITDVQSTLQSVTESGKWHYAEDAIVSVQNRLQGDKLLKASIESKQAKDASDSAQQERYETGDIGQEAYNAYMINSNRYNTDTISMDENGIISNKFSAPAPPKKPDEKEFYDMIDRVTKNPSTLATFYQEHPAFKEYVGAYYQEGNTTGVSPEMLKAAAASYLQTTPEYKQYYNYINEADTFNNFALRDENGNYVKDESGNYLFDEITAEDFRNLGYSVDDNFMLTDNNLTITDEKGVVSKVPIENAKVNLRETNVYKESIANGLNDQEALRQIYTNNVTATQLQNKIDHAATFAFETTDINTIKDDFVFEGYKRELDRQESANNLISSLSGYMPDYDRSNYDIKTSINDINSAKDKVELYSNDKNSEEYKSALLDYNTKLANKNTAIDSWAQSPTGRIAITKQYEQVMNNLKRVDKNTYNNVINNPSLQEQVKDYITGKSEINPIPNIDRSVPSSPMGPSGTLNTSLFLIGKPGTQSTVFTVKDARTSLLNTMNKDIQDNLIKISERTIRFTDEEFGTHPIVNNLAREILYAQDSFEVLSPNVISNSRNRKDEITTLGELKSKLGVNVENYNWELALSDSETGAGDTYVLIPTAKDDKATKLNPIVIKPTSTSADDWHRNITNRLTSLVSNQSDPSVTNAINRRVMYEVTGKDFFDINTFVLGNYLNSDETLNLGAVRVTHQLPMDINGTRGVFQIVGNPKNNNLEIWQLNENGTTRISNAPFETGNTLQELESRYFNKITK